MSKRPVFMAILITLAGTVAAPVAAAEPETTSSDYPSYVSLGDSYTSGSFLPFVAPLCARAERNFPRLVAAAIKPKSFTDASCAGATTKALTDPQVATGNPPQFDALKPDTALVTLGIGGNDIPAFDVVFNCGVRDAAVPHGSPCKDFYTRGGIDTLAEQVRDVAPKVGAALDGIHRRSPKAKVLLIGYPVLLPETGPGCWPIVPISDGDVPFLRDKIKLLNQVLIEQAARHDATYVDTYTSSIGHDMCQAPGTKWLEGPIPTDLAAPLHPNGHGAQNQARQVLAELRR